MNLSQMANFVCGKVRATDAAAIARCKEFLNQRYDVLAREDLWNDLLYGLPFTWAVPGFTLEENGTDYPLFVPDDDLDPNDVDTREPAFGNYFSRRAGVWHLPPTVDRVLALRRSDQPIAVADEFQFYRTSPDKFLATGVPIEFHTMGQVIMDFSGEFNGFLWGDTPAELEFFTYGSACTIKVRYIDEDGETITASYALGGGGQTRIRPMVLLDAVITSGGGAVYITYLAGVRDSVSGSLVALAPGNNGYNLTLEDGGTAFRRCPRIRVTPIPTADTAMRALVKQKPRSLVDDNDEPEIRGIENCLLALAQGDMLERGRQYSKAQAKHAEGLALLTSARKAHTWHEAREMQIVPAVEQQSGQAGTVWNPWNW